MRAAVLETLDARALISRTYPLRDIDEAAAASETHRDLTGVLVP